MVLLHKKKKMQLKQKVDEEATKAKQLIDQASTNDAVHETRDNEITAINKIQPEAIKKLNRNKQSMMLLQLKSSNRSSF